MSSAHYVQENNIYQFTNHLLSLLCFIFSILQPAINQESPSTQWLPFHNIRLCSFVITSKATECEIKAQFMLYRQLFCILSVIILSLILNCPFFEYALFLKWSNVLLAEVQNFPLIKKKKKEVNSYKQNYGTKKKFLSKLQWNLARYVLSPFTQ